MKIRIIDTCLIIASLIVVTFGKVHNEDADSAEKRNDMLQLCINLKNYAVRFVMDNFIETLDVQWKQLHPDEGDPWSRDSNETVSVSREERVSEILQTCQIVIENNVVVVRRYTEENGTELGGMIDIRTVDLDHGNSVIKLGYRKPSCASLRQLLHCMEAESFERMYPNDNLIVLALSYNAALDPIIYEWIALLYRQGAIIDAQHSSAKCLRAKDFSDMKYREKSILEYFQDFKVDV